MGPFSKTTVAFVIIAFLLVIPKVRSWNDASRMATIQSLVEEQTCIIDQSTFIRTGDKVFIDEHFYSDKLILPSAMGAIFYLPLYHIGVHLEYGWNLAYFLITLLTIKTFWLLGLVAFYQALKYSNIEHKYRFWLTLALGIASLHFTWSSTFNNHSLAASQLIIGFYFLLKAKHTDFIKSNLFYAGFFISLAGAGDAPMAAYFVGFLVYILVNSKLRVNFIFFMLPLVLTALPTLAYNYSISGSVIPVQINRSYFEYPGSPWLGSNELTGMSANQGFFLLNYSFTCLLGPKGFLLYNPLLFIALPYLLRETRKGQSFRSEAIIISISSLIIVTYYFLFSNNYGGGSYSIRWFVPLLPLLFFFIHPLFDNFNFKRRRIFIALFVISSIISCIGIINPWSNQLYSDIPILTNLKTMITFIYRMI